jgi:hypothetical protein
MSEVSANAGWHERSRLASLPAKVAKRNVLAGASKIGLYMYYNPRSGPCPPGLGFGDQCVQLSGLFFGFLLSLFASIWQCLNTPNCSLDQISVRNHLAQSIAGGSLELQIEIPSDICQYSCLR